MWSMLIFQTSPALLYDAVQVLALALGAMQGAHPVNVTCDEAAPWKHGTELRDNINKVHR